MKFVTNVEAREYDYFVSKEKNGHFMQSFAWGKFYESKGFTVEILGIKDKDNELLATALLLRKKVFLNYNYIYCPRGLIMDYNNKELLDTFLKYIKQYAYNTDCIMFRMDPDIKLHNIDYFGNVIDNLNNYGLVDYLTKQGLTHKGYTRDFSNNQMRYTYRLDLTRGIQNIYINFQDEVKKTLTEGLSFIKVIKSNKLELDDYYKLLLQTSKRENFFVEEYSYYESLYDTLSKEGMVDLYLVKISLYNMLLHFMKVLQNKKEELEIIKDKKDIDKIYLNELTREVYDLNIRVERYAKIQNIHSDELILSGTLLIKYGKKLWLLYEANNDILSEFNAEYLMYGTILLKAKEEGYEVLDSFRTNVLNKENDYFYKLNKVKQAFGFELVELIGEFDLVTNKLMYKIHSASVSNSNIQKELTCFNEKNTI